jgi:hypothetical protein
VLQQLELLFKTVYVLVQILGFLVFIFRSDPAVFDGGLEVVIIFEIVLLVELVICMLSIFVIERKSNANAIVVQPFQRDSSVQRDLLRSITDFFVLWLTGAIGVVGNSCALAGRKFEWRSASRSSQPGPAEGYTIE